VERNSRLPLTYPLAKLAPGTLNRPVRLRLGLGYGGDDTFEAEDEPPPVPVFMGTAARIASLTSRQLKSLREQYDLQELLDAWPDDTASDEEEQDRMGPRRHA
jgi:hypothetical protein